jgi:hypothetical protein
MNAHLGVPGSGVAVELRRSGSRSAPAFGNRSLVKQLVDMPGARRAAFFLADHAPNRQESSRSSPSMVSISRTQGSLWRRRTDSTSPLRNDQAFTPWCFLVGVLDGRVNCFNQIALMLN